MQYHNNPSNVSVKREFQTTRRTSLSTIYFDRLIARYLNKRSKTFNESRGQRLAVFANDWIGIQINLHGVYEKDLLNILFQFLSPFAADFRHGLALDIGANIGNHSVFLSKRFSNVYAFEPNAATFQLLSFNAGFSGNIKTFNFGLGDKCEAAELYEDPQNHGGSSLYNDARKGLRVKSKVELKSLDSCGLDFNGLSFIKIDVEGHEANVLKGAVATITRHSPIVVFEQLQSEFRDGTTESIEILESLGYSIYWYELESTRGPWIWRRIKNMASFLFGKNVKESICRGPKIPQRTHDLLIGIPQAASETFGLNGN